MAFGSPPAGEGPPDPGLFHPRGTAPPYRGSGRLFPRAAQDEGIARWCKARAARRRHRLQRSGTAAAAVVHARELPPCCRPCSSSTFCPRPPPPSFALGGPRLPCSAAATTHPYLVLRQLRCESITFPSSSPPPPASCCPR